MPQAALSVHPLTKAVTTCLISLMGDPWQVAPGLTLRSPQINVHAEECGRDEADEDMHSICRSIVSGSIIEVVIANGRATRPTGA